MDPLDLQGSPRTKQAQRQQKKREGKEKTMSRSEPSVPPSAPLRRLPPRGADTCSKIGQSSDQHPAEHTAVHVIAAPPRQGSGKLSSNEECDTNRRTGEYRGETTIAAAVENASHAPVSRSHDTTKHQTGIAVEIMNHQTGTAVVTTKHQRGTVAATGKRQKGTVV